jgi:hypothetical protein
LTASGSFCASTLHGCWVADRLVASAGFTTAGGFNAQASFADGTPGGDTYLFGYPDSGKYRGKDLVYGRGPLGTDPWNANLTYQVASQITGGSSGGSWLQGFNTS